MPKVYDVFIRFELVDSETLALVASYYQVYIWSSIFLEEGSNVSTSFIEGIVKFIFNSFEVLFVVQY